MIELCGVVHIHTVYSDGNATVAQVAEAAGRARLDFVCFTDHMSVAARADIERLDLVAPLLVAGYEHEDDAGKNHYLVFGLDAPVPARHDPQTYIDQVREKGAFGFIAHPFERRNFLAWLPSFPWTAWDATGYDGIEIWNQMSDWVEGIHSWAGFIRLLYPRRLLAGPPSELLKRWDELCKVRFIAGIGGVDAHTRSYGFGPIKIPVFPLKVEMRGIRTHLWVDESYETMSPAAKRAALIRAMVDGCGFISNFRKGDARNTIITLTDSTGRSYLPGIHASQATLPARLDVSVSEKSSVRLTCNSTTIACEIGTRVCFPLSEPGVYRIEIRRNEKPWVYSNPFRLINDFG